MLPNQFNKGASRLLPVLIKDKGDRLWLRHLANARNRAQAGETSTLTRSPELPMLVDFSGSLPESPQ